MDNQIGVALRWALQRWCAQPGAFTAARNGGAESVLRNAVLGELEVELSCLGFAEANGAREDASLMVAGAPPLCFEFKHGMLHPRQLSGIEGDSKSAIEQLQKVQTGACYYVHFVHALECDDPNGGYAFEHNIRVTPYKKFQARTDLQELLPKVTKMLGPVWYEVPIRQARFPGVRATLYCWAFSVKGSERVALPRGSGNRTP